MINLIAILSGLWITLEIAGFLNERKIKRKQYVYYNVDAGCIKGAIHQKDLREFINKNQALMDVQTAPVIGWMMKPAINNGVVWSDQ